MFSAMLLAISIAALMQFGLYYWRAVLAGVAALPLSDRALAAAGLNDGRVTAEDFATFAGLHELTPELFPSRGGLGLVRLYYYAVAALGELAGRYLPSIAAWTEREGAMCARYAAVQVDRRVLANLALVESLHNW